jgi:SAM-dependent methyltransferase
VTSRAEAQSFDRVAADYDRLGELDRRGWMEQWLASVLPAGGRRALDLGCGTGRHAVMLAGRFGHVDAVDLSGPMVELAGTRRPRTNISYRQADLHDVDDAYGYDFILSVLTLHHVPDLHAALKHIKGLLAPGGRVALLDIYPARPKAIPRWRLWGNEVRLLGLNLVRRGPAAAWETYRLATGPWLEHRVSDRFFSRAALEQSRAALFPGARLRQVGGRQWVELTWDAPLLPAGRPNRVRWHHHERQHDVPRGRGAVGPAAPGVPHRADRPGGVLHRAGPRHDPPAPPVHRAGRADRDRRRRRPGLLRQGA